MSTSWTCTECGSVNPAESKACVCGRNQPVERAPTRSRSVVVFYWIVQMAALLWVLLKIGERFPLEPGEKFRPGLEFWLRLVAVLCAPLLILAVARLWAFGSGKGKAIGQLRPHIRAVLRPFARLHRWFWRSRWYRAITLTMFASGVAVEGFRWLCTGEHPLPMFLGVLLVAPPLGVACHWQARRAARDRPTHIQMAIRSAVAVLAVFWLPVFTMQQEAHYVYFALWLIVSPSLGILCAGVFNLLTTALANAD